MPNENMRVLVVRRVAALWCFSFVSWPGSPAKSIPVLASFAKAVATKTYIILSIVATSTIVVKLILDVVLSTVPTCNVRLCV
jgi:hypothetical protein